MELFERDRDLFTQELDLVFLDTTSVFVYRPEVWVLRSDGREYLLRTDLKGTAHPAFAAAGVRPPSPVTPLS